MRGGVRLRERVKEKKVSEETKEEWRVENGISNIVMRGQGDWNKSESGAECGNKNQ